MTVDYDLEERLLEYSARIIRRVERLPDTRAGNHSAGQLLRSGTSPLPNHGEAQAAESATDFVHKLKICLKELRESHRWLLLIQHVPLLRPRRVDSLVKETDELIRIFVRSIQTAQQPKRQASRFKVRSSAFEVRGSFSAGRGGHPDDPGVAGAQGHVHDDDLHARAAAGEQRDKEPAGLPLSRIVED